MAELNKGSVLFKYKPEDFIVEEVWENSSCKVSDNLESVEKGTVDFEKLDVNDRRTFLTCELEKINVDHFTALSVLGKALHAPSHEIGYAGIKDKVAWTCQRISIFDPNIDALKDFSFPGIALKNFRWVKHKIKVGDLIGNRFSIVLRDAGEDAIKILNRVRNSEELPNLFGVQRFGSLRKDNVLLGRLLLKQRFKDAAFAYLTGFGEQETEEVKNAKKQLKSEKDLLKAQIYFPHVLYTERRMLDYIVRFPEDWLGALKIIDQSILLLMCQSVQSKIFNDILERVVEEHIRLDYDYLPILGYNSHLSPGRLGKIEAEVLQNHGLDLKDFSAPRLPFLQLKPSSRKAFFEVKDLQVETGDDELFPLSKKIKLSFSLDSGTYATTFLDQFFVLRESRE